MKVGELGSLGFQTRLSQDCGAAHGFPPHFQLQVKQLNKRLRVGCVCACVCVRVLFSSRRPLVGFQHSKILLH